MGSQLVFGSMNEECNDSKNPVDSRKMKGVKSVATGVVRALSAIVVVYLGVTLSTGLDVQIFPYPDTPLLVAFKNADVVAIDSETFPDESFRMYLRDAFDFDNSGGFSEQEIEAVNIMNVRDLNISDLTGLEIFPKLMDLNCLDNPVESIPLSGISQIKRIDARNCPLKSLSLPRTAQATIEELYVGMTEPSSWSSPVFFYDPSSKMIAYSQSYNSEKFQIDHPSYTMLFTDLPGIPERGISKIENGKYSSVYVHIEDIGDFSGYGSLKTLSCIGLSISRITNCPSLTYIDMRVSAATKVYISGCQSIETIKSDRFIEFDELDESVVERWDRWIPSTTPGSIIDPESQEYLFVLPYVESAYQKHIAESL